VREAYPNPRLLAPENGWRQVAAELLTLTLGNGVRGMNARRFCAD